MKTPHEERMHAELYALCSEQKNDMSIKDFSVMVDIANMVMREALAEIPDNTTVQTAAQFLLRDQMYQGLPHAMMGTRPDPVIVHKGNILELWRDGLRHLAGDR